MFDASACRAAMPALRRASETRRESRQPAAALLGDLTWTDWGFTGSLKKGLSR
jgi:hypothetical protein